MEQCHQLKGWYESEGSSASLTSLTVSGQRSGAGGSDFGAGSNMKTFAEAKQENIGMNSDKAEYFSATGMVAFIKKENALYQGCANMIDARSCNKKVTIGIHRIRLHQMVTQRKREILISVKSWIILLAEPDL